MKAAITISAMILFLLTGCGGNKQSTDDLITVDVTASYPKKELILQDFMDVEYIPLETNDEFVCQGFVKAIGKDILIVKNYINDGNIFIFNRKGKALKKINRLGQGAEEYTNIFEIILDEDNGEMFISDIFVKKIFVYDLDGKFIRSFKHKEGAMYNGVFNFNRENLICHDGYYSNDGISNMQSFMIISKQDGSIIKEIQIPFEEKKNTWIIRKDETNNMTYSLSPSSYYPIIPNHGNWLLVEPSSDTIYSYSPNYTMVPIITRTPSVQSMNPEVFLFLGILSNRYCFIETVKKDYDFDTQHIPSTSLMYDKQEKATFRYTVYNGDFSDKKEVFMQSRPVTNEIATWQPVHADKLALAYKKGQLKGELKEIAANLDEESNPVVMLIKHKKQ